MALIDYDSFISFTKSGASADGYVSNIEITFFCETFDRAEYRNERLNQAPTLSGAQPQYATNLAGQIIQQGITCTGDSARPIGADDNNLDNIKRKFNVTRYTVTGALSTKANVDQLQVWAIDHQKQWTATFKRHQEIVSNEKISYGALLNFQNNTFTAITTTGISVTGIPLGGVWINNIYINSFKQGIERAFKNSAGTIEIYKTFVMEFDVRTYAAASSVV